MDDVADNGGFAADVAPPFHWLRAFGVDIRFSLSDDDAVGSSQVDRIRQNVHG
jgi:hypothetical protein